MVRRSPTITLIGVFVVVYLLQVAISLVAIPATVLALSTPVTFRPWTLVTSVYAHGSPGHLLANSVMLLLVGLVLERQTSRLRFHLFFLVSGVLAGLAQVWIGGLVGPPNSVLGASGGIFALLGYVLTGNRVTDTVLSAVPLKPEWFLVVVVVVAGVLTAMTAGPNVALIAHFTGLLIGLLAGRAHVLRP